MARDVIHPQGVILSRVVPHVGAPEIRVRRLVLAIRYHNHIGNPGSAYFPRKCYPTSPGTDERHIVHQIAAELQLLPADLHQGVKALWGDKFIDAHAVNYRESNSVRWVGMDGSKGIRENDEPLYKTLMQSQLARTRFTVHPDKKLSVKGFSVDPAAGTMSFTSYSAGVGDTDRVIREILRSC